MLREFLLVAAGGALGAVGRYGVSVALLRAWGFGWPWGTLVVNVVGGLLMGCLYALAAERREAMLFLGVGVLGGFTTFSAFSIEVLRLIERGDAGAAGAYALASVALCVGAAFAGFALARALA